MRLILFLCRELGSVRVCVETLISCVVSNGIPGVTKSSRHGSVVKFIHLLNILVDE